MENVVEYTDKSSKSGKCETICKNVLENIYNKPFIKVRPDFLRNPLTGENLELDCYNEELKLALEFNGDQHYFFTPEFHKSYSDLYYQKCKDDYKKIACKNNGIKLIIITYTTIDDLAVNVLTRLPRCYLCNQIIGNNGKICMNCKNIPSPSKENQNSVCSCGKKLSKKYNGIFFDNCYTCFISNSNRTKKCQKCNKLIDDNFNLCYTCKYH